MKTARHLLIGLVVALLATAPSIADDISNGSWNTTDASNNASPPNGWPAGMTPNNVEPSARANMGGVKRFWERANPSVSTTGTSPHYVYTPTNVSFPTAYTQGEVICAKANFTSVGSDDLNVNSLGAKPLYISTSGGVVAISAGVIRSGGQFCAAYDSALNSSSGGFQLIGGAVQTAGTLLAANNLSELTASASTSRTNISAAKSGSNSDITGLSSLTGTLSLTNTNTWPGFSSVNSALGTWSIGPKNDGTSSYCVQLNGSGCGWTVSTSYVVAFPNYGAGALSTNGSGVISSGTLSVGNGGTGNTTGQPSGTAGGDLGGSYPNPTVLSLADVTTGTLAIGNGGTGSTTASAARTALGLGNAAVKTASGSGSTVASVTGSITNGDLASFADTSGTVQDSGKSVSSFLLAANNLSDVTASTAKTNLCVKKADIDLGDANGTASSVLSGAHGISCATPTACWAYAVNTSGGTQNGYTNGAEVLITAGGTSRNDGVSTTWDSTNVKVTVGANGAVLIDAATFNGVQIGSLGAGHWHIHGVCIAL